MNRAEWYAWTSATRRHAREHTGVGGAKTSSFTFTGPGGVVYSVFVHREHVGVCRFRGTPVDVHTSRLQERPRRALHAASLDWARKFRRSAAAVKPGYGAAAELARVREIRAARAELEDMRAFVSAFNALPG